QQAEKFATRMIEGFEDQKNGGFFFTSNDHEELLVRSKHLGGGGNMPNPNGVAALVLVELFELTGDENYRAVSQRALQSLAPMMERQPAASDDLLLATSRLLSSDDKNTVALDRVADSPQPATGQRVGPVVVSAIASKSNVTESDMFTVTLAIDIDDGWHLYADNPDADFLQPSSVSVAANEGFVIGQVVLPKANRRLDKVLKQTLNTYTGHIEFKIPVTVKAASPVGETRLSITVTTQACDASRCLPVQTTMLTLPVNIVDRTDN
ncbi:MAG: hypothetical protein KDA72_16365, partial [Planctomycetales bacterium]|nr:hypothetical protein [Planctomycetales bacterium]